MVAANRLLKPLLGLVDGRPEQHPEGVYALRYKSAEGKHVWESVGCDSQQAVLRKKQREVKEFLEDFALRIRKRMVAAYTISLNLFLSSCPRRDKPDGHFLRRVKKTALRGGLNCGHCVNKAGVSCRAHPVCNTWELHRLRQTFATMHHESGVSARTLMKWLGRADLETVLKYL